MEYVTEQPNHRKSQLNEHRISHYQKIDHTYRQAINFPLWRVLDYYNKNENRSRETQEKNFLFTPIGGIGYFRR